MQAVRINEYGGPEVLHLAEVPQPVPAADEILVKVYASGVNPADWVVREGGMRSFLTLPLTLGWDAAGVVAAVGTDVTAFRVGEAVYGEPNFPGDGSYAEYCAAKASQFAPKPASLSFVEAAGVPLAGLTAWTALFHDGQLRAGQRVLVQGASGGVGGFAVQFAKAKGAYVIATASAANLDYVRGLGADEVLDYQTQPVAQLVQGMDLVLEASPQRDNAERVRILPVLKPGGLFVTVNLDAPFDAAVEAALAQRQVTGKLSANQPRGEWLREIAALIDAGQVRVLVSRVYPLSRRVRGKLVLEIQPDGK